MDPMGNAASCVYWRCSMFGSLAHCQKKKTTWLSSFLFPPKRNMALFPKTTHISRRTFVCFLDDHPSNLNGTLPTDPRSAAIGLLDTQLFFSGVRSVRNGFFTVGDFLGNQKKTQEKDASSQCDDAGARVAYLGQMLFCLFFCHQKIIDGWPLPMLVGLPFSFNGTCHQLGYDGYDTWLFQFHWLLMSNK